MTTEDGAAPCDADAHLVSRKQAADRPAPPVPDASPHRHHPSPSRRAEHSVPAGPNAAPTCSSAQRSHRLARPSDLAHGTFPPPAAESPAGSDPSTHARTRPPACCVRPSDAHECDDDGPSAGAGTGRRDSTLCSVRAKRGDGQRAGAVVRPLQASATGGRRTWRSPIA